MDYWILLLQDVDSLSNIASHALWTRFATNIIHHLTILGCESNNIIINICYAFCWSLHLFPYMNVIGYQTFKILCNIGNVAPLLVCIIYIIQLQDNTFIMSNEVWVAMQMVAYRTVYFVIKYTKWGGLKDTVSQETAKLVENVAWYLCICVTFVAIVAIAIGSNQSHL